jgi:hypothetical protein
MHFPPQSFSPRSYQIFHPKREAALSILARAAGLASIRFSPTSRASCPTRDSLSRRPMTCGRRKVIASPDERADYQANKLVYRNRIEPSQDGYYAAFRIYPGAVTTGADCEKTLR